MSDASGVTNVWDLRTREGVEALVREWWLRAQNAVKAGLDLAPTVVHVVKVDPMSMLQLDSAGVVCQLGQDPTALRKLALQLGSFALGFTYPTEDSVAFVLEHPAGDRAWFGIIDEKSGLSEPTEIPEVLRDRKRVLDAVDRTLS